MHPILFPLITSMVLWFSVPIHAAELTYHVTRQDVLPGDVKWDYLTYDAASKRLFITRGDHVDVYDAAEIEAPGAAGVRPQLKPGTFTLFTVSR